MDAAPRTGTSHERRGAAGRDQPARAADRHDVVGSDAALTDAVRRTARAPEQLLASLKDLGELAGTAEAREHGMLANRHEPELIGFDRYGHRIDEVRFHPSWHWLMTRGVGFGLAGAPWTSTDSDAHLRRAAGFFA